MKVSSNIMAVIIILLVSAAIISGRPTNSNRMNACGVYFNNTEEVFRYSFKQTMIDGLYCVDIKSSEHGIECVNCITEMMNEEDALKVFTNTVSYIYTNQEGITKVDSSIDNVYIFTIGHSGFVTVELIGQKILIKFIKKSR